MTQEQQAIIVAMRQKNARTAEIAAVLGCSISLVQKQARALGVPCKRSRRERVPASRGAGRPTVASAGTRGSLYAEDADRGLTMTAIAAKHGVTHQAVSSAIRLFRERRAAEAGQ